MENVDTPAKCEMLFARLNLAWGNIESAAENIANVEQFVEQNKFIHLMPDVAALQILVLLRRGDLAQAADLAENHKLSISQARVHLAQGDVSASLAVLEYYRQQLREKEQCDDLLKAIVLQAIAFYAHDQKKQAVLALEEALTLAEGGGLIRIFVDEGAPMADLLSKAAAQGIMPNFVSKLLGAFETVGKQDASKSVQSLIDPLSERELEILQLIAQGLSNREISERLFLALNTIKGHNRRIFNKLQVQRRTEAVARARELNLL
jgi:LuxR family maltose regulon positive regulatory protein